MKPGLRNLITDVAGLRVGNAEDHTIKTGVTVLIGDAPFVAAVDVMGGSPGARETELLAPDKAVEKVDALVLAGGSVFGLDAASGVSDALSAEGRGYSYGGVNVPIVPAAILFDLINGGDKDWDANPYRALGVAALHAASEDFPLGTVGAGTGATTAGYMGGLGSASLVLDCGISVGALVASNPAGQVVASEDGRFWAGAFEIGGEFGGRGAAPVTDVDLAARIKLDFLPGRAPSPVENTTLAIIATDAILTKAQAKRLAVAAQDGIGRAIVPAHSPVDGDLVFALAAGAKALPDPQLDPLRLGHAAAICLSRAIARSVYLARGADGDLFPTWQARFGG